MKGRDRGFEHDFEDRDVRGRTRDFDRDFTDRELKGRSRDFDRGFDERDVRGRERDDERVMKGRSVDFDRDFDERDVKGVERDFEDSDVDDDSCPVLTKLSIGRIARNAGVSSLSGDVYDVMKDIVGKFMNNVVKTVSRKSDNISTVELEPVVERLLKCSVEDMERTEINMNSFARYVRDLGSKYGVNIRKDAMFYLHISCEFYIYKLFVNAVDIAKNSRRTRVTVGDLNIACRI